MSTPVPVTLVFEGVMVGRYDQAAKIYEMGVLPVPSHSFTIEIQEHGPLSTAGNEPAVTKAQPLAFDQVEITPDDAQWRLEIVGSDTPSARLFLESTPPDRTQLGGNLFSKKLDYRWVIDADTDLPNHKPAGAAVLPRHEGLLKPVLNITVGEFYARELFGGLVSSRQGGKGPHKPFGFVPQQVVADFTVDAGREVLLKQTASDKDVFRLKVLDDHSYTIFFRNAPSQDETTRTRRAEDPPPKPDVNRPTHFQLLYLLFNVPPEQRYELRALPTGATPGLDIEALAIGEDFIRPRERIGVPTPRCSPIGG